ncbi:MAG: DNA polymerase Y family protein [Candidatus Sericytochromatia bacterium]|nr:DNA polymerase Y family protein [Candidatus Sericytochromatia bacterium]
MDRTACIDVPLLALQLLLRAEPGWRQRPVAVLEHDRPHARVLALNRVARQQGICPGERYQQVLARVPTLEAAPVSPLAIAEAQRELLACLLNFSPTVEPRREQPGCFWVDAAGFEQLYPSPQAWGECLRAALQALGFEAAVVIGHGRFAPWALARAQRGRGVTVYDPAGQAAAVAAVPLSCLELPPDERHFLLTLGVDHVAALQALPAEGLIGRLGPEALALCRLAREDPALPLQPASLQVPLQATSSLPHGVLELGALVFAAKPLVDTLLARLAAQGQALAGLTLRLGCDTSQERPGWRREAEGLWREEALRPAEATLSSLRLMELVRLRLEGLPLPGPVHTLVAIAEGCPLTAHQLDALAITPRRDPAAGARALARLRAAFGENQVVVAQPGDRHLPERRWHWEPVDRIQAPNLPAGPPDTPPPLVRSVYARPRQLAPRPAEGWWPLGAQAGALCREVGPFRLAGGWWHSAVERDYYFIETESGDLLWVYRDNRRGHWLLQGRVQ